MATVRSNSVAFVDLTDAKKIDVYIASNLPTSQIYDKNNKAYSPDWRTKNLELKPTVYLDGENITNNNNITFTWYRKVGSNDKVLIQTGKDLTIISNELNDATIGTSDVGVVSYICSVKYKNEKESENQITFARVDTGKDGTSGASAPAVQAQYSADGNTGWTNTFDPQTHKYIHFSYDNGATWSKPAIKIAGDDGKSIELKGVAYAKVTPVTGQNIELFSDVNTATKITNATEGDSYLVNGYLCTYNGTNFVCTGQIQGPRGEDGDTYYLFIRYADNANGNGMSASSNGKSYIGFYRTTVNQVPTDTSSATWGWTKFVGEDAKNITLTASAQAFKTNKSGVMSPSTITVTAQTINTTIPSGGWTYSTDGGKTFSSTATGVVQSGNTVTITGASLTTNSLTVKASDGTYSDIFTVYKISDGVDGTSGVDGESTSIAFLNNENISFVADANGQVKTTSLNINVVGYEGTTKVVPRIDTIMNIPTGMTIGEASTVESLSELQIPITIANNATLGSTASTHGTIDIPITYPVTTILKLTWSKINTGAKGESGTDGYTVMLTNESHTFAGDVSNALVGSTTTQVLAYKGSTAQSVTITSVNGKAASTTDTDTGISGLKFKCSALSGSSPTITFTCTTSFVNANGSIPIVLSIGGVSFTKMFTYSIAFKGNTGATGSAGANGAPATAYWLISSASAVQKTSIGTITVTPSTLTFTGKSQTGTNTPANYACRWVIDYSTDGTNYTNLYTSTANEATKAITVLTTYKTIRARMYMANGTTTLLDEQIIPIVSDGAKGVDGVSINSVTVDYGESTSASTQPTSWQSTIPTIAEGSYLWTRTITDYTDTTIADTVTYTYAKQGKTGTSGSSVTVKSIEYQEGSSATTAPTGTWSNSVVAVAEGKYLWTKTTFSDNKVAYGVAKQGQKGDQGVQGPKGNDGQQYYTWVKYADTPTSGMSDNPDGKIYIGLAYNKTTATESTTYSDYMWSLIKGETGAVGPKGDNGQQYYTWIKYADNASGVNMSDSPSGKTYIGLAYNKTTSTESTTASDYTWALFKGDKGDKGNQGDKGADAYTVILTNESHIFAGNVSSAVVSSATTQVLAYKGGTSQSVTIVSVDGKTASTSSTATSIAGLSFSCSALSGTSPTITFTCTTSFVSPSGTIPIVLTVDGVTITKMFTYSIAFKGAQGSTGTAASLVDITPSALYFKSTTGKDGTFTPDYIYLYPRFQTVTYSKWEYSVDGGTTWVAASGANGLSISTYNSVANTLRVAKTSTLYTDTVTSISFRCVSSNTAVYDTVSIAKIYDVVDLQIGGRNYILNSANLSVSGLGSSAGSRAEYRTIDVGQSYMNIENNTEVTISFDLEMTVNTANPTLMVYNSNRLGPKMFVSKSLKFTAAVGETIKQRCSVVTQITDRENPSLTTNTIEFYSTYDTSNWFKISNLKLEIGNKATDWSPAPEDLNNITFQVYAPKGTLLTDELPSLTLQTFPYEGSIEITSGATFQWSQFVDNAWVDISGANSTTLTVTKADVLKAKSYRCVMTYKSKTYTSTITVQDKTDTYESIMCISSNTRGNNCYWVLYTLVYTDAEEVDPLLGPISINAPTSPVNGSYWYAIDETNASVQLKKYNGTSWVNSTDTQSLSYYWDIINNGSEKVPFGDHSKVQVVSCNDFTATATLVCGVNNVEDGLLTQSSLSLTDASDPIVSTTEPTGVVDGQIWIKPNNNGTYIMSIWDATNKMWVVSDMDTRTKVHTSKPSTYSVGDLWITASDTEHSGYLEGTLLMANTSSSTFSESHWSTTLKYDKDLDSIKETLNDLSQYVNITSEGLKIGAQSASGELSPFTSLFTSTELAFYQNSDKLLTLANNQLTAPHIVVEDELEVGKSINLGNLSLTIETNGSFSFAVSK